MAQFEIVHEEGTNFVRITLQDETVRAEAGALSTLRGKIVMDAKAPSFGNILAAWLSEESLIRPSYTGTGVVCLKSSLGGFHVLDLGGGAWVLSSGCYWASDGGITLSVRREPFLTSFYAGEGFFDYSTRVEGRGTVVLATQGPVEEVRLDKERLAVQGKYVLARSEGVQYTIRRPTRTYFGRLLAKEPFSRTYEGTGALLVSTTPYWRYRMAAAKAGGEPVDAGAV